jgi:hypothetical protein
MNATWLNLQTDRQNSFAVAKISEAPLYDSEMPRLTRKLAGPPAVARCPNCDAIVYSRRSKLCGVCAEPLPKEFLFSPAQERNIEWLLEFERLRHRVWMRKISL